LKVVYLWVSILAAVSMVAVAFATPVVRGSEPIAEWTIMVYLDGDNNLDPDSVADIAEMMQVGSTPKVNVLVLWDRLYEPAYVYKVLPGDLELMSGLKVNGVDVNGQEVSMADQRVLDAFVEYGEATLPAKHYMLDLWDHGNAFGYACWDDNAGPGWQTGARALSLSDVGKALVGTAPMDILTYDGCTIGMMEVAYQLTMVKQDEGIDIQYLVASEEYIPNLGYAYNNLLAQMNLMDDLSAEAVSAMMVHEYAKTYSPHGQAKGSSTVGLSAIDLSLVQPIAPKLKALTDVLDARLASDFDKYHSIISEARGEANLGWSLNGWDDRVDLGTVLAVLSESDDSEIAALAGDALAALTSMVHVANTPALDSQSAYGIGIWFPGSLRSLGNANTGGYGILGRYSTEFDFAADAGWLEFLYAYWGKTTTK